MVLLSSCSRAVFSCGHVRCAAYERGERAIGNVVHVVLIVVGASVQHVPPLEANKWLSQPWAQQ